MDKDYKKIISNNLFKLRKKNNLTQADLASKLNYSDKSISKWENGDAFPDIEVLAKLADFYGVSFDFLLNENLSVDEIKQKINNTYNTNKICIAALSCSAVWMIATVLFIYFKMTLDINLWTAFIWSVPICVVILYFFNHIWGKRKFAYSLVSIFLWSLLACLYLQWISVNIWYIFFLGIPIQISIILSIGIKRY